MIQSKLGQRIVGLIDLIVSTGFTAWIWNLALTEGIYYRKVGAFFPIFAVCGLGLLLFPIDVDELRKKYGVETLERFEYYPLAWKILAPLAVAAGLANWLALERLGG